MYSYEAPFEVDDIVSINGRDLDSYNFRNIDTTPAFYGIIEEITVLDDIVLVDTQIPLLLVVSMGGWMSGSHIL